MQYSLQAWQWHSIHQQVFRAAKSSVGFGIEFHVLDPAL